MYLPDSILQETNLNHEEITSGCWQWEFLVECHCSGTVNKGQLIQHVTTGQLDLHNHWTAIPYGQ